MRQECLHSMESMLPLYLEAWTRAQGGAQSTGSTERDRERVWDRGTPSSVLGRGQPGPYSPDPAPWQAGEHETPGITSRKHLLDPCRWAQLTETQALDRHPRPIFCTVILKSPTCMTGVCGHFQISDSPQLPVARSTERCLKTSLRSPGAAFVFLKKGIISQG